MLGFSLRGAFSCVWYNHFNFHYPVILFTTGIDVCPTREITASSGIITSPNYPQKYPPNSDCTLTIKQPLNRKILFKFPHLDLGGGNCQNIVNIF